MDYVLDTHVLLWWLLKSSNLSKKHEALLDFLEEQGEVFAVSVMTLWEIAQLVERRRFLLQFALEPWLQGLEIRSELKILPLTSQVILDAQKLGTGFPRDPADRLIAATARTQGAKLLTVDQKIIDSGVVATV